jgi:hypothetical protein
VARDFVGFRQQVADVGSWLQPPVAVVSVIVTLEGPVRAGGRALPGAWRRFVRRFLTADCSSPRLPVDGGLT